MLPIVLVLVVVAPVVPAPTPSCLLPPVAAPVVDRFREPECTWCPGNRGLTYATRPGLVVRAAASGTVTFSDAVAGTRYVVVEHGDGLRATYGGLSASDVRTGARVSTGASIGRTGDELHFGIRRGDVYLDPEPMLGRLVERARLVPTDGTRARPAPPPRVRCPGQ